MNNADRPGNFTVCARARFMWKWTTKVMRSDCPFDSKWPLKGHRAHWSSRNCPQPCHATCLAGRRDHRPHADTSHARVPFCLQYSASNSIYIWCARIDWANRRSTLNGMERNKSGKTSLLLASAYCDETNEWWKSEMIKWYGWISWHFSYGQSQCAFQT